MNGPRVKGLLAPEGLFSPITLNSNIPKVIIPATKIWLLSTLALSSSDALEQKTATKTTESKLQQLNKFKVVNEVNTMIMLMRRCTMTSIELIFKTFVAGSSME